MCTTRLSRRLYASHKVFGLDFRELEGWLLLRGIMDFFIAKYM